ncbi:Adrenodoxin-like protein, mitochondrial [Hondaea fermentalgiana]|uniref:2Fe-2S ferredoxin n=1 Tax=Hondaea fermentalgiana TaxID=2315210 RepID=A0A2R5GKA4_9STRA|nr:Adrenodoxin-like protein, mitochondrial [Hondaea fermentalgiana]|eukprot:GBG30158.1 Adrenodoxin-like protein, mitochondrial [Hondaea fermentalgiana]
MQRGLGTQRRGLITTTAMRALAGADAAGGVQPRAAAMRREVGRQVRWHGDDHVNPNAKTVHLSFVLKSGEEVPVEAKVGQNLLRLAQKNDVPLEGACECSTSCSTCHVILEDDVFEGLMDAGNEPTEDEDDMLDQAFGLTETSRLGCQVLIAEYMEGTKVQLPSATRNFYVDGHVPEPH